MSSRVKGQFLRAVCAMLRLVCILFFDRKYISGRHFEASAVGYLWSVRAIWHRNILRLAPPLPWPAHFACSVANPQNIFFHPDDLNSFQAEGAYFQAYRGKIKIGRGVYIARNVGIITANHDPIDLDGYLPAEDVEIGDRCWIGMGVVILPGVVLGPRTTVGANSVVTKSFPEGNVIIAGSPARIVRNLTPS